VWFLPKRQPSKYPLPFGPIRQREQFTSAVPFVGSAI
jgi:hypothetical protein